MSAYDGYDGEPRRYRTVHTRPRRSGEPDYVREETYIERGVGPGPYHNELVRAPLREEDSIEDIQRDFPPPNRHGRYEYDDYDRGPPRRSRSAVSRRYSDDSYYDDRHTGYGTAAAGATGAAAGYAAGRHRDHRKRRSRSHHGHPDDYSDYSSSPSRASRSHRHRKSGLEDAIGALGLGGVAAALTGRRDKDRDDRSVRTGRSRSRADSRRSRSSSRTRSGSRGGKASRKWAQAAQAALATGVIEAIRSRNEPGGWGGQKASESPLQLLVQVELMHC